MTRFIRIVVTAAGFLALVYSCAYASNMSLKECVASAIENSPELSSQHHQVKAFREDITKKKSTTLPYLSSQIQTYEINGTPVTPWSTAGVFEPENGVGRRDTHWTPVAIESVGVTYPILYEGSFFGLNDPPIVTAARAQVNQQQILELISEQKVIFNVVSDFIYANSYRQQLVTLDRILELLNTELNIVEEQVRLGHQLPQNAQVIQAQRDALETARTATYDNQSNFIGDLSGLVGLDRSAADRPVQIEAALPPLPRLPSLRQFLDEVMSDHPALRVAAAKLEIARQQLRVDEANQWPTAVFTTTFAGGQDLDYFSGSGSHVRPTAFQSYLTLTIPLFDFGGRHAAIGESHENVLAQRDERRQTELDLRSSITGVFGEILDDVATIARLQSGLERDQEKLTLAQQQMSEGDSDQLNVLQAETATLQDTLSIELAEMSERLKFATLQNLSAGQWHWAP